MDEGKLTELTLEEYICPCCKKEKVDDSKDYEGRNDN